ncbi:hypothetical protein ACFLXN_01180 [Chloroflexota bacterium]
MERTGRLSNLNLGLIIFLLILVGIMVRVYPNLDYHPVPGDYDVNMIYPTLHILDNGHELVPGEIETAEYTHGIYVATNDRTKSMLPSILCIVSGINGDQYFIFERFSLFAGVLLLPFSVLLLFKYLCRRNNKEISSIALVFLFSAAVFGNATIIASSSSQTVANTSAIEASFLILAFYFLLRAKQNRVAAGLFMLIIICITLLHRTSSMFLLCVLIMMLATSLITKMRSQKDIQQPYPVSLVITGIVIIIAYYMYLGKNFFGSLISMVEEILGDFNIADDPQIVNTYLIQGSVNTQIFKAAVILASGFCLVYFLFYLSKRRYDLLGGYKISLIFFAWLAALIPFSLAMWAWAGLLGVFSRVTTYASVVSLIGLAIILSSYKRSPIGAKLIKIIMAISMVCSILIYLIPSQPPVNRLTYAENDATQWLSLEAHKDDVIFTDYRLCGPLTLSGFMLTMGALQGVSESQVELAINDFKAIYYENDTEKALSYMDNNPVNDEVAKYIFFSRRMSEVGVKELTWGAFKPPPEEFMNAFSNSKELNKIYDNNIGVIYIRK